MRHRNRQQAMTGDRAGRRFSCGQGRAMSRGAGRGAGMPQGYCCGRGLGQALERGEFCDQSATLKEHLESKQARLQQRLDAVNQQLSDLS